MNDIKLIKITDTSDKDLQLLIEMLDGSFATAMADCPEDEKNMPVPNGEELLDAIKKGMEVLKIYASNQLVGASVLVINEESGRNMVDLLFISADSKGKGIGTKVWSEIEASYPDTKVWCLGTPYFLKRNIHFYVNKCGFAITKYYNKWNPMIMDGVSDDGDFFWFEKQMQR